MTASSSPDEIRVLVVGDTGVGKTLLLRRLHQVAVPSEDAFASTWSPTTGFNVEVLLGSKQQGSAFSSRVNVSVPCVAFIELGGNRNFGHSSEFPISLMSFDGVIFVYDRYNANSAIGLSYWYEDLKSYGIVGNSGGAKVMLLETALSPSEQMPSSPAEGLPDELIGAYLQRNMKSSPLWRRVLQKVRSSIGEWVGPLRLSVGDFLQQRRSWRLRVAVLFYYWASQFENLLLFFVAVILFGPYQQAVRLRRPTVSESLQMISGDVSGTQTVLSCPLFDQLEFEASALENLMSFVDSLKHD